MDEILGQFSEYRHAVKIWKIIPPFFLVLGTLGNLLTIVVLMRRRSRASSTAMYLTALAVSDLLILYTGLLRQWIKYLWGEDVRHISIAGCKIHVFLVYLGTQCSSWLLVAVTCERFIGVWLPHKVKTGCTPRSAGFFIGIIVSGLCLLNTHWFYGMGKTSEVYENKTYVYHCNTLFDHYNDFLTLTWPWIDLCMFCLIPFTILLIGNVSIIIKVLLSKHKTRAHMAPPVGVDKIKRKDDRTTQLTAMLLTLNSVFLFCATPISIYLIGEPYWYLKIETYHDIAKLQLWWAIVNIFMYLNHTINFVLYFLSGSRFREEVKTLFCGGAGRSIFGGLGTTRVGPSNSFVGRSQTVQTVVADNVP